MPKPPVVSIDTLEDLKRVLFIQRQITRKAHDELEAVASDTLLDTSDPEQVQKYMKEESELLRSYAMRPTLAEWAQQGGPEVESTGTWGASFGVAILTGELVLEQIRQMHPQFAHAVRPIFLSLLTVTSQMKGAIDDGEIERVVMKFQFTKPDGSPFEDEIKDMIHKSIADVVQTIVATGVEYGLFEERESGAQQITELGQRVLLHMTDIQEFLGIMGEAHKRFQSDPTVMNALAADVEAEKPRKKRTKSDKSKT